MKEDEFAAGYIETEMGCLCKRYLSRRREFFIILVVGSR
jgi:hypothetical protein